MIVIVGAKRGAHTSWPVHVSEMRYVVLAVYAITEVEPKKAVKTVLK